MMGLKETLEKFALSDKSRDEIRNGGIDAPFEFEQVAKTVLAGHIIVACGDEQVVIRPTCVEFYYHEEFKGGIKDLIVYHRNPKDNKKKKEKFKFGILHNHVSGIDITFEGGTCPDNAVRASLLIREFEINGKLEKRPTRIYEALFSQFSIFDGFYVKWIDGDNPVDVASYYRKNVAEYDENGNKKLSIGIDCVQTSDGKYIQDRRKWQFRIKGYDNR